MSPPDDERAGGGFASRSSLGPCPVKWCKSSSSSIAPQTAIPSFSNSLKVVPGTPPMSLVIDAWVR